MIDKVYDAISKFNMLENCKNIVIGVSGGADSMSLLKFFSDFRKKSNINVLAVHINHCLRGEESDRDENFVKEYCTRNDINLKTYRIDIAEESRRLKIGLEECGRKYRYEIFSSLATSNDTKIATAHTLSDNIETVFINLIRGTGIKGLCGIPPVRNNVIRPLSFVTRDEIEKYYRENNVDYIVDSSNLKRDYDRNKIRLDIIPLFKNISGNFEESFGKTINQLRQDNEYLEYISSIQYKNVCLKFGYDAAKMKKLPVSIMSRVIIKIIFNETSYILEKKHVEMIINILKVGSGTINIPGNFFVILEREVLYVVEASSLKEKWEYKLNLPKILTEHGKKFIIKIIGIDEYQKLSNKYNNIKNNCLDYDKLGNNPVIRNKRIGDYFMCSRKNFSKSLKKLFSERKIPIAMRNNIAIISNSRNEILWVESLGVSDIAVIDENTKNVLIIISEETIC